MLFLTLILFLGNMVSISGREVDGRYTSYPDRTIVFYKTGEVELVVFDLDRQEEAKFLGTYSRDTETRFGSILILRNDRYEKYLVLKNDVICYLIDEKNEVFLRAIQGSPTRGEFVLSAPSSISASSFLEEGNARYFPTNMNASAGLPWVEGVRGYGEGEKIFIRKAMLNTLYISIGFVLYGRPELYKDNARPKQIRLSVDNKFSFLLDLVDTPDYQTIKLPIALTSRDQLVIEIVDVYAGEKYQDTCINSILYDIYDN
jgi:hypothetical protein